MQPSPPDLAQVRLDNALALFEEFVRATARHADAAALRGLERRFAERLQIQPSYWSQIKGRSRQIGERLARQFEHLCHKPRGWMDTPHTGPAAEATSAATSRAPAAGPSPVQSAADTGDELTPLDEDERFIVGLVLTYYRRHPQRARTRLLDLLGEVLLPAAGPAVAAPSPAHTAAPPGTNPAAPSPTRPGMRMPPAAQVRPATGAIARAPAAAESAHDLWLRTQKSVAPLKSRK